MALARTLAAVRAGVLAHLRLPVVKTPHQAAPASWQLVRGFAEGTYLDKDDVTERILNVVKNFDQKVDQSKVHDSSAAAVLCMHNSCTSTDRCDSTIKSYIRSLLLPTSRKTLVWTA